MLAGGIVAGTDLRLQAGELVQQGSLQAGRDADLQVAGTATNTGFMGAQRHLSLSAETLKASNTSQMAAGVRLDRASSEPMLLDSGDLTVQTQQALRTQGEQLAAGRVLLAGASVNVAGSTSSAQDIRVEARSGDVDASDARLVAGHALTAQATQTVRSGRAVLSAQALSVQANDWSNQAGQVLHWGDGDLQVNLPGTLDNRGGTITSNAGQTRLAAAVIDNRQGLLSQAGTALQLSAGQLDNTQGAILSAGALEVEAGVLQNQAGVLNATQLALNARQFANQGGVAVQSGAGRARIDVAEGLGNHLGTLGSAGSLELNAAAVDNTLGRIETLGATAIRFDVQALQFAWYGALQPDPAAASLAALAGAQVTRWRDVLDAPTPLQVEARHDDGTPALLRHERTRYLAGWLDDAGLDALMTHVAREAGLAPLALPPGLRLRRHGGLQFAIHYGAEPAQVPAAPGTQFLLGGPVLRTGEVAAWRAVIP